MSSPPTHAVSPTVPVAFALAEARHTDGREIIAAAPRGSKCRAACWRRAAPERGSLPLHTPGVIGVMGSTVASAHLMKLNAQQLAHALGIAASRCAGLSANTGSMVKCTHCGHVASAGLEAVALAARGFTANPDIFSAPRGYVDTFFKAHFDYDLLMQFGKPYRCVDPGMAIKFYPSKYPTHYAIAAALDARGAVGKPSKIRSVRLVTRTWKTPTVPSPRAAGGQVQLPVRVAAALLDGEIGIKTFTDERRFGADMKACWKKSR